MLFLNAALLFGLIGIGIPIALHLFSRKSAKIVPWGAMRFLEDSLAQRTRRIQLEDALLMAARCLLFGMLALCVARPFSPPGSAIPYAIVLPLLLLAVSLFGASIAVWQHAKTRYLFLVPALLLFILCGAAILFEKQLHLRRLTGAGQQDIALIIDGSTSMTLNLGNGESLFDQAIEEAREVVMKAGAEYAFSIILAGPAPVVKNASPRTNRSELDKMLAGLEPLDGEARFAHAIEEAAHILEGGNNESKQILVFTDGQNVGWEAGNASSWKAMQKTLEKLPHKPQLSIRRFPPPEQVRNLALTNIEFTRDVIGVDRGVEIEATLENTGTEAVTPSAIQLQIGDKTIDSDSISQLTPGMKETLRFEHHFTKPGAHVVTASVRVADDIQLDNTFSTALTVIGKLKVLIVDGNPAARYFDRASAFIETALAPGLTADAAYLVEPVVIPAPQILSISEFEEYQAVVLADVPRLPDKTAQRLADYVAGGGGLLLAPGTRADPKFYNAWDIVPANLDQQIVAKIDKDPISPALGTFDHHALRKVGDSGQSDFAGLILAAFWKTAPRKGTSIAAKLNNGDPFVLVRNSGTGAVVQICCALDARSSNLATRQSFLPFVHELTYFLASPEAFQLNLHPAAELTVTLKKSEEAGGDGPIDPDATTIFPVMDPAGETRKAGIFSSRQTLFAKIPGAPAAGLYEIRVPESARPALAGILTSVGTVPFTVIRSAEESSNKQLSDQDLAFMGNYVDVLKPESSTDVLTILAGKSFGEELWRYMALGALFLLVAEVALTRWIARNRKTGVDDTIDFESAQKRSEKAIRELRKAS